MSECHIRAARPGDEAGAYQVCLRTGDHGDDGEPFYREDPDALGRIYVGPYLAFEPALSLVLEDQQGICGYALGAFDSRAFYARYEAEWGPELRARFPAPHGDASQWTSVQHVHHRYHHPDYFCPEPYEAYPSHLHIDLLPRVQGRGYGRRMLQQIMDTLRRRGSPGAHLGVSARNTRALGFYQRVGFHELIRIGMGSDAVIYMGINLVVRRATVSGATASASSKRMSSTLALLGGSPVRTRPFPAWPIFGAPEEERLLRTLRSAKWGRLDGAEVAEFEKRFAATHGCRHGIAVANGTVALRIALLAAGIRADEEVIVPPYTFVSTATAVIEANAVPVFADIDLNTFNLDPRAVEAAVTSRTRAIIPVHFAGQPADMDGILRVARDRDLVVIEDAAHAHGARYRGRPIGSIGHMASFSFQSSKNLTAGEGGIITTNDDGVADASRSIHNCGRVPGGLWYEHHVISGNYRLSEFQGAILNCQLDRLEEQTRTRDRNGQYLASCLAGVPGLHPQARSVDCTRHGYHLFMLRIDAAAFGAPRAGVLRALEAEGIPCSGGYGFSLPDQPLFRNKAFGPFLPDVARRLDYRKARCPNSDLICAEQCIWLEQNLLLGSREDMEDIFHAFEKIHEHRHAL